jgi:hypothetical protein
VLPPSPSTFYDMKVLPGRYFTATLKLCKELGAESCKFSFCPTRSSCNPCHAKHSCPTSGAWKSGTEGRNDYNDWMWDSVLDRKKVDCGLQDHD